MKIIYEGKVPQETASCYKCGCTFLYFEVELSMDSRDYYLTCPQAGCETEIYLESPFNCKELEEELYG